jgi:uncharacterized protein with HEPN domain
MSVNDDLTRLKHMLEAAQKVAQFTQGETRESLTADEKLQLAIVRLIEIIGEAASRISDEFRDEHSQIPWVAIRGMRNRLVHAYFDIDLDVVWNTITTAIPVLINQLEALLLALDDNKDDSNDDTV